MNKLELKKLIREELKNALSEKEHTAHKDYRKDTTTPSLNEAPQLLIPQKDIIANAIEDNNIPNEEFTPQRDKGVVVNFIRNGNPSEDYLRKMMGILKKNGVSVNFPPLTTPPSRSVEDMVKFNAILSKYLK